MSFKLNKEKADLPQPIKDKINALDALRQADWNEKFESLKTDKIMLENIIRNVNSGKVSYDDVTEVTKQKIILEEKIPKKENELLGILNEPLDKTELDKIVVRAIKLSNPSLNIRPGKGSYQVPKIRK